MEAQWEYGRCYQTHRGRVQPFYDTPERRVQWFKECLSKLGRRKDLQTIAFPEKIGCVLAGGDWRIYLHLIVKFADTFD